MESFLEIIRAELAGDMSPKGMNILIRRSRRDYDSQPAVAVALRYKFSEVAAAPVKTGFRKIYDETAVNRMGRPGAMVDVTSAAETMAVIAAIRAEFGTDLPVHLNVSADEFDAPLTF